MPIKSDKSRDPTQIVPLQIRIREELRSEIEQAAKASGNSMNSEIAERLAISLREDQVLGSGPTRAMVGRIASDIALIEGRTGKLWTDDLATFEAVRLMIEATVGRHRPPRENQQQFFDFLEREKRDTEREDVLTAALLEWGVLELRQPNALLALTDPSVPSVPYHGEAHPDQWHKPGGVEEPLSREDRNAIVQLLQEWRSLRTRYPERLDQLRALKEPIERAEREGAQIYHEVTGSLHAEALKQLEARSGT